MSIQGEERRTDVHPLHGGVYQVERKDRPPYDPLRDGELEAQVRLRSMRLRQSRATRVTPLHDTEVGSDEHAVAVLESRCPRFLPNLRRGLHGASRRCRSLGWRPASQKKHAVENLEDYEARFAPEESLMIPPC